MLNSAKLFSILWMITGIYCLIFTDPIKGTIFIGFGITFHLLHDIGKLLEKGKDEDR